MSEDFQRSFEKSFKENIFLTMELSKMSYDDVMAMPVKKMEEYLNWKIKFDQEREKAKADSLEKIKL
jgi:hypothetical protein